MAQERSSRREVLDALKSIPSLSDLLSQHEGRYDYELDLEVIVYGRNYDGKRIGPYVRLLEYVPGETVVREGEWGGNSFYVVVSGLVEVFIEGNKIGELGPGLKFGEMSVLAGIPRNATVNVSHNRTAHILEVQRPALRLLRKLPRFSESLDKTYRSHGKQSILKDLQDALQLTQEIIEKLDRSSQLRVFSKNHVLTRSQQRMARIYIVRSGWMSRVSDGGKEEEDIFGEGYCIGSEGILQDALWPYTIRLLGRTEVLEVSSRRIRENASIARALYEKLSAYAPPEFAKSTDPGTAIRKKLIETGLADGTNLILMDMDLCVRCGNCSFACHQIHGQSRLTRRGIHLTQIRGPRTQHFLAPSACLHCKDPECLTGCPTGAIGRYESGHIDIHSPSCIGCGDCASQCPYHAISLVPAGSTVLSAPAETQDDMVAVKCNLCQNTSLNRNGSSKRPVYACEESCPTGALVRVNPKEYFTELKNIEHLVFQNPTHATGRNIHQSDAARKWLHIGGIALTLIVIGSLLYGLSLYGYHERIWSNLNMRAVTGIAGLLAIGGILTYPVRRKIYKRRAGPLRYWMIAHAYLGVIAAGSIFLHGGIDSGGWFTTALALVFDLVIATGVIGILTYRYVPRIITAIEEEPLMTDDLLKRSEELQNKIAGLAASSSPACGTKIREMCAGLISFPSLLRQIWKQTDLGAWVQLHLEKYKQNGLSFSDEADRGAFKKAVEAAAMLARVNALLCLHRLLKLWLAPHVLFTSVMIAMMIIHIVQVFYF